MLKFLSMRQVDLRLTMSALVYGDETTNKAVDSLDLSDIHGAVAMDVRSHPDLIGKSRMRMLS